MRKVTPGEPETRSPDLLAENLRRVEALFPEAFTEGRIDFDALRGILGGAVDDSSEKFGLSWRGKHQASRLALVPSTGALRPCPDDSVEWDTTRNIVIEGDNLEVLKLLHRSYGQKVRLIYIDPPYNTGKDFVYSDNYRDTLRNYQRVTGQRDDTGNRTSSNTERNGRYHTNWLNMMYPRLRASRDLLHEHGLLCVSIDDHECHTLRTILDELYGEESFVGTLTWTTTTQPDNIGTARFGLQKNIEYVLMYSKCPRIDLPPFVLQEQPGTRKYTHDGRFGKCRLEIIERAFDGAYARPTMRFPILGRPPREGKQWQIGEQTARQLEKDGRLEVVDGIVKRAIYPQDDKDRKQYLPFWAHLEKVATSQAGKSELSRLLPGHGVNTVKPISLVQEILRHLPPDSLVLDFFAGTGTTAHAVYALNVRDSGTRRVILIQLPLPISPDVPAQKTTAAFCDTIGRPRSLAEITKERLRRAGAALRADPPTAATDLGFRVFRLDSASSFEWDPRPSDLNRALLEASRGLKPDRTEDDLFFGLLASLGYDLSAPVRTRKLAGKTVRAVENGRLVACLAERLTWEEANTLADRLPSWLRELGASPPVTVYFRDDAFENSTAKINMVEVLRQRDVTDVRSL